MATPERIGRYPVVRLLKRGGMGTLYLCDDPDLPRRVAVKVVRSDLDPHELRARFAREIAVVGALRHRNIVTIYGTTVHDGAPVLVMEHIPGDTLAEIIARGRPLAIDAKLRIVDEICAGLEHAHASRVVHRDIKPANVMLDVDGTVKLLDFGVARIGESELTSMGAVIGTLNYMAPEQVRGEPVDERTDVFAVGAVCYELLAYRQAFPGTVRDGVTHRILHEEPEPLSRRCVGLPDGLEAVVVTALSKNPAQRHQNVTALRVALAACTGNPVRRRSLSTEVTAIGATRLSSRHSALESPGAESAPAAGHETRAATLASARDAITTGEFSRAMSECREILTVDPDNVNASALLREAERGIQTRRHVLIASAGAAAAAAALAIAVWAPSRSTLVSSLSDRPLLHSARIDVGLTTSGLPGVPTNGGIGAEPTAPSSSVVPQVQPQLPPDASPASNDPTGTSLPPRPRDVQLAPPPVTARSTPPEQPASELGAGQRSESPAVPGPSTAASSQPDQPFPATQPSPAAAAPGVALPPPAPEVPEPVATRTEPAQPAPSPLVSDTAAILQLLRRYAAALVEKDVAELRELRRFDAGTLLTLQQQLRETDTDRVTISSEGISIIDGGRRARVKALMRREGVRTRGRVEALVRSELTMTLEKVEGRWMIVEFSAR